MAHFSGFFTLFHLSLTYFSTGVSLLSLTNCGEGGGLIGFGGLVHLGAGIGFEGGFGAGMGQRSS